MAGPFYNAIKGTTAAAPGAGAFTPNAASAGHLAWSTVPAGWIGLVRYEDGTAWELQYSYWSGTTLSRSATTQFVASSTGSALTLSASATASMAMDANETQPHIGGQPWAMWCANNGLTTITTQNMGAPVVTGTAAAVFPSNTNYFSAQPRIQYTSATTANAQSGWGNNNNVQWVASTTAGVGGGEYTSRFGCSALPASPKLWAGMFSTAVATSTAEPSALSNAVSFLKNSTDANIQFCTSNASTATKVDTGIPLVANGWYEASVWLDPGSGRAYGLLIRLDTGAIWYGSLTATLPAAGSTLKPFCYAGLSATTGTAIVLHIGAVATRSGA